MTPQDLYRAAGTALSIALVAGSVASLAQPAPAAPEPAETMTAETTSTTDPQEPSRAQELQDAIYERVSVVGEGERAERIPGSARRLSSEDLELQKYSDVQRVLRQIPGVNLQDEEGYGLRPNIGIRGTGVERSQKITVLEDGVLIAPAPYTAPAAYYFPTVGRMQAVEVRKGSAAIQQGPYTNGGALNLVSRQIPTGGLDGHVEAAAGGDETRRLHAYIGDSYDRFGWMVETYHLETDGFKDLDGGGDTGFDLRDYLVKLQLHSAPDAALEQYLELKLGRTEQSGHETYLGLTESDFRADPFRRYAASAADRIDAEHEQIQLRHFVRLGENLDLTTTVYANDFYRDWFKNERVDGISNASILADPQRYAEQLAILRGERDSAVGALTLRHNQRDYQSRGVQSMFTWALHAGRTEHQLEIGVRYHEDEEDRFQRDDLYQILGGDLVLSQAGAPGSQTNRLSDAEAVALFLQDEMQLGRFNLTTGVRFESIDYVRRDYSTSDPTRELGPTRVRRNGVDVVIPGVGLGYELSAANYMFLGVHKGFSPPGPGSSEDTQEEESWNYELGWRHSAGRLSFEAIGFYSDYDNLLGRETVSGGGDADSELFNGGAVEVRGLELSLQTSFNNTHFAFPLRAAYTWTQAEFQSSFATSFADWAPRVDVGDELPYLPQHQFSLGTGIVAANWGLHLDVNFVAETRARAGSGPIPADQRIDDRVLFDLSADYTLFEHFKVFAQLRNVTDETYIVARRPYGVRPGLPRTLMVGLSFDF